MNGESTSHTMNYRVWAFIRNVLAMITMVNMIQIAHEVGIGTANLDEIEVVGVCTSICVMDTVGGLANRDYKITVPVKGVADFDPEMHQFSLKRMEKIYGADVS